MHLHLRRLSAGLVLALPLVVTTTAAGALGTSTPGTAPGPTTVAADAVRLDPSSEHEEMSGSEHEESLQEDAEHQEMSGSEHEESLQVETEHQEMSGSEHEESLQEEAEHQEMSGSEHEEDAEEAPTGAGHDDGSSTDSRARALVLGLFGLANAGVVVSAAVLRRRSTDRPKRRPAAPATALTAP